MKVVYVHTFGGPEHLSYEDAPSPVAAPGQALVAVEAAGVGFVDIMARQGTYPLVPAPGFVPGVEVAGVVLAVGDPDAASWIGRRVFARASIGGGYAEQVIVDIVRLIPLPDSLSAADAVATGVNALVAKLALLRGRTAVRDRVLVRGASGGIGMMAVQIAAEMGAIVTAVTSSAARGERLRSMGASAILERDAGTKASNIPYDVIVDTVAGPDVGAFVGQLAVNGRYVLCGGAAGPPPADFAAGMLAHFHKSPSFHCFSLYSASDEEVGSTVIDIFAQTATGVLQAPIEQIFPLREAADAHRKLESGTGFGKIILVP